MTAFNPEHKINESERAMVRQRFPERTAVAVALTAAEFAVLNQARRQPSTSQRALAQATGLSLGTVNATLKALAVRGWVMAATPTPAGLAALEPYRVDNAIVMAAGLSTRFAPLSYEKPKGLLQVNGEVLIERTIRQLQAAGIGDITVVVGYKMEQFLYLEDRFGVHIAVNTAFAERNNNSTLKVVEDKLANTYICSADNYFSHNVFEPYVWRAYYAAVWQDGPSSEWGLAIGPHDRIVRVTPGAADCWIMLGQAYFDRRFSATFRQILNQVYDRPETAGQLWESIYADHLNQLDMRVRRYPAGVIHEFDSLDDLRAFDPDFILNIDSAILDNICGTLHVSRSRLDDFRPIEQGLTNLSFRFRVDGDYYVYRHPGVATHGILNRAAEADAEAIARDLGLDLSYVWLDADQGWKISRYVNVTAQFDYHNPDHVSRGLDLIRRLHQSGQTSPAEFDIYDGAQRYIALLTAPGMPDSGQRLDFPDFEALGRTAQRVSELVEADQVPKVICHNDFYDTNLLIQDDRTYLIDWEYVGMGDYASDLGVFICCSDYTYDEAVAVLATYFGRPPTAAELRHCLAYVCLAAYHWWTWALYKDACGESVGDYTYRWYRFTKDYGELTLALYGE